MVTQDAVVSISANIDGGQPWRRTVGTENIIYTDWQRDNYFVAIQQALPKAGRIGIEFDHLNLVNRDKLASRYPQAELVDVAAPCMRMRMIKSAEEHAIIRHGARVAILVVLRWSRPCETRCLSTKWRCTPPRPWSVKLPAPSPMPN